MVDLSADEREWFERAIAQLDAFESAARSKLEALSSPPQGDQAARRRELRRRARIERLPELLRSSIQQVTLAREALTTYPHAGKAVYHALMTGMFSRYPDTADVRDVLRTKRENAHETNFKKKASGR